jgi:ubiquinone/menaquinone biosynthesis C-methylase UbiE
MARSFDTPLRTLICDAASVPLPDRAFDTVTLLHLLEHLEPGESARVLREAIRLARERVVIAVPFEDEPADVYGHLRRFDLAILHELGRDTTLPYTVAEQHGGWLVLDTHG